MSDRLRAIYERVTSWQRRTFPMPDADHAKSLLAHMRLELKEIEAAPRDIEERADMAILAMGVLDRRGVDPALYHGAGDFFAWGQFGHSSFSWGMRSVIGDLEFQPHRMMLRKVLERCTFGCPSLNSEEKFLSAISAKMDKNEARKWPTPDQQVPGEPVEHIRDEELYCEAVIAALTPAPDVIASEAELLRARVAELEAERAEWGVDNERLRSERQQVREVLGATPFEGALDAARRHREGGR